jgi:hypothetical protein
MPASGDRPAVARSTSGDHNDVRSFEVKVQNLRGEVLERKDLNLAHGIWANADSEIPEQIRLARPQSLPPNPMTP